MKRMFSCFLALLLLLGMAGCASDSGDGNGTGGAVTEATSQAQDRQSVTDGLPDDLNYGGREFRTLIQESYKTDIWVEANDPDPVNQAVFARNQVVNSRLNVSIAETTAKSYTEISTQISKAVQSGTYDYDLVMQHMIQAGNDALGQNFLDWYTIPYVDFSREWYPSFAIEGLTVNGKMLIAVGDMLLATIDRTYCIFYDKAHAKDLGVSDVSDLALNGLWTAEKLTEYAGKAYQDLNGDGKVNVGDYFGFANDCVNAYSVYYYCFDLGRVTIDEEYQVELHYNDDNGKIVDAIDKLKALMLADSTYCWMGNGDKEIIDVFMDEQALFCGGIIGEALSTVRQYDNDYGILPYPKFDADQANYYTIMGGGVSTMEVLSCVSAEEDLAFIGAVVEAMCSETWRSVIPPYYDVALKYKGTRDQASVTLLDIILDSRAVDVAIAYDGWEGLTYKLGDFIHTNKNWTSSYKSLANTVTRHYQKVADLYEKIGI